MGLAMAGTLAASLSTLPSGAWEVIFGALTAWFAYRVAREYRGRGLRALVSEHHAPHLLHSAAMLYMFLALRTVAPGHSTAMAGMSAGGQSLRLPTLALLFAFLLCAYVVADLDRVPPPHRLRPPPPSHPSPSPVPGPGRPPRLRRRPSPNHPGHHSSPNQPRPPLQPQPPRPPLQPRQPQRPLRPHSPRPPLQPWPQCSRASSAPG